MIETRRPIVITDGGPWAEHDQACAVCSERPAILQLWDGVYQPCGACATDGWELKRRKWRVWRRRR